MKPGWTTLSQTLSFALIPGYQLLQKDRDCYKGGRAAYVAENLSFNCVNSLQGDSNIEALWFEESRRCSK